eukprot:XP_022273693.1 uncharacterized protein LOC111095747 [Canis lupus familiaris]
MAEMALRHLSPGLFSKVVMCPFHPGVAPASATLAPLLLLECTKTFLPSSLHVGCLPHYVQFLLPALRRPCSPFSRRLQCLSLSAVQKSATAVPHPRHCHAPPSLPTAREPRVLSPAFLLVCGAPHFAELVKTHVYPFSSRLHCSEKCREGEELHSPAENADDRTQNKTSWGALSRAMDCISYNPKSSVPRPTMLGFSSIATC